MSRLSQAIDDNRRNITVGRRDEEEHTIPVRSSVLAGGSSVPTLPSGQSRLSQAIDSARRGEVVRPQSWQDNESGFQSWVEELNSFSRRMSSDYASREGVYQSATDLGRYRDDAYASIGTMQGRSNSYRSYFENSRDLYGDMAVDSILSALDQGDSYLEGVRSSLGSEYDYWSQWASEKDYNDYQRRASLDIDAAKAELANLESQIDAAKKEQTTSRNIMVGSRYMTADQRLQYGQQQQDAEQRYADLEGRISALRDDIEVAERMAQGRVYSGYREADDFKELSRYASTANGREAKFNAWSGMYTETGFDDITYDYINRNETARGHQMVNDISSNASFLGVDNSFLQQMTDDEIATFNYIYATQGRDPAYEYINFLASDLNYRQRVQSEAEWAAYAKENPIGSSVFSILESPLKGLSYLGQTADYLEDGKIDQNAAYNKFSYLNTAIRGQVSQDIENAVEGFWGKAGSFGYQTGMSMGDFLFNTAITGGNSALTLGIMGTEAAADATIAAKDRGLPDDQAYALGTIAGAAEIITEKVSLDALLNKTSLGRNAVGYLLTNILAEGSEEVGSDFINLFADILIAKDKSEWKMSIDAYQSEGMTETEAFWHAVLDQAQVMGLDFLGGGISGGVMAGGAIGINTTLNGQSARQTGAQFRGMGEDVVQATIQEGLASDPSTQSYKLAQQLQQKLDQGQTITDVELGRLYQANVQAINAEEGGGDLLTRAAEELAEKGRVTNNTALDILENPNARATLETEAGLSITEDMTKSQQRAAVKEAVDRLASRETATQEHTADTETTQRHGVQSALVTGTERTAAQQVYDMGRMRQAASTLGESGAKALAAAYDGSMNADGFYAGFAAYYEAGVSGMDMGKVQGWYSGQLNEAQRYAAYTAGQNDAAASLAAEREGVKSATVYGTEAGFIPTEQSANLPRSTVRYYNDMARAVGIKIQISPSTGEGGANGWYANGILHIAQDAENPGLVVAKHEVTHRMQELAPEEYRRYRDYAMNALAERDGSSVSLVEQYKARYAENGINLTTEQAMDEIAADFTEALVVEPQQFERLARQNRSMARRLLDAVRDFIRKVKSVFKGNKAAQNKAAADAYGMSIDTLEEAVRLWGKALEASSRAAHSAGSVVGTHGGYSQTEGKFSLKGVVEENGSLLALHNLTAENLRDALKLGGLPMPSIAIVQAQQGHAKYGEISLVFDKSSIDPAADRRNRVYGGDGWTPTAPTIEYEPNSRAERRLHDKYYELAGRIGYDAARPLYNYATNLEETMNRQGGEQGILETLRDSTDMMNVFLADTGKGLVENIQKEVVTRIDDDKIKQYDYLIEKLGEDVIQEMRPAGGETPMSARRRWMDTHGEALEDAYRGYLRDIGGMSETEIGNVMDNPSFSARSLMREVVEARRYLANGPETRRTEFDGAATSEAIRAATDVAEYEAWLRDTFGGIEGRRGIYNGRDPYTSSGNPRSWGQLHYAYTLENIVKAMSGTQEERGQGAWGIGATTLQAVAAPDYRNIQQIKDDSGRLGSVDGESYSAAVQAVDDQISSIITKIKSTTNAHDSNSFIETDNIATALKEAARGKKTVDAIMRSFAESGYKISSQTAKDIQTVYKAAAELPTEYFEAKPQRAVGFGEVLAAVVPDDMDAALRSDAEKAGMRLLEYKSGDDTDRLAKVNSVEGARFSLKTDSMGRALTAEQQEYFRSSTARDAQGRLLVLYHGTQKGGFTVFRDWSYLTASQSYATKYVNRDTGDTMYEVYANIQKPFDTRLPECRELFQSEYLGKYANTPLQDIGLPDWTDGYDLVDFIEENGYDYDAILLDEGPDPETGERTISYAVRSPEQIKNVTNAKPTSDPDIRYSLKVDNRGRRLTQAQEDFFADSVIRDGDGHLMTMYHGTLHGGFTVFDGGKDYFYFTNDRRYAYAFEGKKKNGQLFPSMREGVEKGAYSPQKYEVYLNVKNPFIASLDVVEDALYWDKSLAQKLRDKGYDALMLEDMSQVIVLNPEQIKLTNNKSPSASDPDIRRSLKGSSNIQREMAALQEENRMLRERVDYWRGQTRLTERVTTDQKSVRRAAQELIRSYGANIAVEDIQGDLQALYDYIASGSEGENELTYTEARHRAEAIAQTLVENAVAVDDEGYRQYSDLRDYLRAANIVYGTEYHGDIADFGYFRRGLFGKLNLKTKGHTNIDQVYKELSERWPEFFNEQQHTHPTDQLLHIAEVLEGIYNITEYNPFSYHMEEAVARAANEIMEGFFDLPQTRATFADRQARKLDEAKAKGRQQVQRLREQNNARLEELRQQNRQRVQRVIERERTVRERQLQRLRDHYAEVRQNQSERRADSQARSRLLKIARRLQNKKLPAVNRALLDQYIGDLDTTAKSMTGKTLERLTDLREWYDDRKQNDPDFISDPAIEADLARLSKRHISDLTAEEVADLTRILLNIENELRTERQLIDSEDRRDVYLQGVQVINDVENSGGSREGIRGAFDNYIVTETLSPVRQIKRMAGYVKSDPMIRLVNALSDGQRESLAYQMEAENPFQKWAENKRFRRDFSGADAKSISIAGLSAGKGIVTVEITPAMRAALYLHSLNDQNLRHIRDGGITVPDMRLYRKGKLAEAYARGTTIKLTPSQVRSITAGMTAEERAFARAVHDYFNGQSRERINAVSEKLKGYPIAQVEDYFPINTDSSFTRSDFETLKFDGTLEGMGFLKERQAKAANPILLRDVNLVLEQSIAQHGKYVGLAIPVRNFNKVWGVTKSSFNDDGSRNSYESSVQKAVKNTWGESGYNYVEKLMTDLQSGKNAKNIWIRLLNRVRSNYAGAVLTLNMSVAMKQAASYPTAAAVLGWWPLARAMGDVGKVDLDLIAKYTPLQWYRSKGFSTKELGDLRQTNGPIAKVMNNLPAALNWVQGVDLLTTRKLWKASEYYVRADNKGLAVGTDAYYKAVADVYNRVIEETQPNYTTMQRPQLLRSDDSLLGNLAMFKTQPFQNFNILYDAIGEYRAARKNGTDIQTARTNLNRAVTSQLAQLAVFAGMTMAWAMFRGKREKYEDEEGEMTVLSVLKALGKDMAGGQLSSVPFGSDAWELLSSKLFGDQYYGMDAVTITALADTVNSLNGMGELLNDILGRVSRGEDVDWNTARIKMDGYLDDISKVAGVPYENVANLFNASYRHICIAALGKYQGEYAALKLTADPEKKASTYYDLLYQAMVSSQSEYQAIYQDMVESGSFEADKIKSAMESRMKSAQGVENVSDLEQRFLSPAQEQTYSGLQQQVSGTSIWSAATAEQRSAAEDDIYNLIVGNSSGEKLQDKIDGGAAYGIDEADYILYRLALHIVDQPTESGKLGSYTGEEVEAAIEMLPGLSDAARSYLWEAQGKSEKSNPYK